MKKALLLPMLILSYVASFSQQKEKKTVNVSTNKHMRQFLDSRSKQKRTILLEPLTEKEYPQQTILLDTLRRGLLRKENQVIITNSIPVWSPDKNYVFNMPGSFAYDKSQTRIHTPRHVTVIDLKKATTPENTSPAKEK
ncbi:hypothetical protein [Sediminibacterium sp. KACHI17]